MTEATPVPSALSTPAHRPVNTGRAFGWLAGLPILAVLWGAATYTIEAATSEALLGAALRIVKLDEPDGGTGAAWLRLRVSGRDLIAEGDAPDEEHRKAVLQRLAALPGLRRIADEVEPILEASPFVWQARLTQSGRIEFEGHRPAEIPASELLTTLASAASSPAILVDHTHPARRAPPDFVQATAFATAALRWLKPGAKAKLTDTLLTFEGEAVSPEAHDAIRAALANPPHGFGLGHVAIAPPTMDHYRLAVTRRPDGAVRLDGYVSSDMAQRLILSAAAEIATGAAITNDLQLARGLAADIDEAALTAFAMRLAGLVRDGRVEVVDRSINVSGLAIDAEAVGETRGLMREARPGGTREGTVALEARPVSPYHLQVRRDAGTLILSGHVPDETARQQVLSRARSLFVQERIANRLRLADGAPAGLLTTVGAALAPLSTLATGEIEISDQALRLSGESLYPGSAERTRTGLPRAMPPGWTVAVAIKTEEGAERYDAATCSRRFDETVAKYAVRFAPGSSELTPDLHRVLDAAAEIARHCPAQRFEVAGYTDAGGAKAEPVALPEYTASIKTAEPARKPAAKAAKPTVAKPETPKKSPGPKDGPKEQAKDQAKDEAKKAVRLETGSADPPREPLPDLADQRASVVLDYLLQAGVPADRASIVPRSAPQADRMSLGLVSRS